MKIAIHTNKRSFADRWEKYCKENDIEYKLVNAYDNDIIENVKDCNAFMWHFHHADYRDMQFAKSLLFSLQKRGLIRVGTSTIRLRRNICSKPLMRHWFQPMCSIQRKRLWNGQNIQLSQKYSNLKVEPELQM